jgi:hypothetical protein
MPTLARSHILSSIPKQGPALSEAIMDAIVWFQKRSGANALPLESFQISALASPSSTRHVMASHNSCDASLFSECVIIVLAELTP